MKSNTSGGRFLSYIKLMRLHRPIGIFLVLWPALWALWIAAEGVPDLNLLVIFVLGAILMRSAGCVINDYADRKVDGHVRRTRQRPIVAGEVSVRGALVLFGILVLVAFVLVLQTNRLTVMLSFGAVALAFCYPFMKRHTHLPQVVLGAAFAWAVPMAFAAQSGELNKGVWLLYIAVVLWTIAFDTFYAMVDREDDLKVGVKSTAILFGDQDKLFIGVLQGLAILALAMAGQHFELGLAYQAGLVAALGLFVYQQFLIRKREPKKCFNAFLNNNWVGVVVFIGVMADYL